MHPKNRIIILSDAIRTGKTTTLANWLENIDSKAGFICPDIENKRKLLNLQTGIYYDFELKEKSDNSTSIGKFHFSNDIIQKACKETLDAATKEFHFLIMDEIGKLEIETDLGFYPILNSIISNYQKPGNGYLILVIRDTLLQKALIKFNLKDSKILNLTEFKSAIQTHALVLAGGNSSRMGLAKGLISYHGSNQQDYLYSCLKLHCDHVYLSLKTNTTNTNPSELPCILDDEDYTDMGPTSAYISALNHQPLCNWILIACDYPFLKHRDIEFLYRFAEISKSSVCYGIEKMYEPLLAVYHLNDHFQFWNLLNNGNQSLFKYQKVIKPKVLMPISRAVLFSANTPEEMQEAKELL
ncbi:MAG: NTP transferase domain-containing protein [Bacteroidia bacterium]